MATRTARIADVISNEIGKFKLTRASAPWAFKTATHAINCITFNVEKNLDPYLPKADLVVSIAVTLSFAPINPMKKSNIPPRMCPRTNGIHKESKDDAVAICMPASISETDIATPNHINAFVKIPVRFSIL